jgi:hypothetical protein
MDHSLDPNIWVEQGGRRHYMTGAPHVDSVGLERMSAPFFYEARCRLAQGNAADC